MKKITCQKGFAQVILLLLILSGLALALYFVSNTSFFQNRAGLEGTRIEFSGPGVSADHTTTTSQSVYVNAFYVPPATASSTPAPAASTPAPETVISTTKSAIYGGNVTLNYQPAPIGTVIRAYCYRNTLCGRFVVGSGTAETTLAGKYKVVVYGSDGTAGTEGYATDIMAITFTVNGNPAVLETYTPWHDKAGNVVNLFSNNVAPSPSPKPQPSATSINTLQGVDGSWCALSDPTTSYNIKGTCKDSSGTTFTDYCDGGIVRNYYCTFSSGSAGVANVKCAAGGYTCPNNACTSGACVSSSPLPSPSIGVGTTVPTTRTLGVGSTSTTAPTFPDAFKLSNTKEGLSQPCPVVNGVNVTCQLQFIGNPTTFAGWKLTDGTGQKTVWTRFLKNGQPLGTDVSATINYQPATPTPTAVSSPTPISPPITKKVMLLIFDPILSNGQKLHQARGWQDPKALTNQIIESFKTSTNGAVNYQITETQEKNEWPRIIDGFRYTEDSYNTAISTQNWHRPDDMDYNQFWTDLNLCSKIASGAIDEVFLYGAPGMGFDEFAYKIPGDKLPYKQPTNYWMYQGRKKNIPDCNGKTVFVMGWSYERGLAEALESYSHRIESSLGVTISRGDWDANCGKTNHVASDFDKFTCLAKDVSNSPSGIVGCGNAHSAFNGNGGYDRDFTNTTQTACLSFDNYPVPSTNTSGNCNLWGCTADGYLKWWMSHIPKRAGVNSNGNVNNWWKYIIDFDNGVAEAKGLLTPTPTPSPTPSPSPTPITREVPVKINPSKYSNTKTESGDAKLIIYNEYPRSNGKDYKVSLKVNMTGLQPNTGYYFTICDPQSGKPPFCASTPSGVTTNAQGAFTYDSLTTPPASLRYKFTVSQFQLTNNLYLGVFNTDQANSCKNSVDSCTASGAFNPSGSTPQTLSCSGITVSGATKTGTSYTVKTGTQLTLTAQATPTNARAYWSVPGRATGGNSYRTVGYFSGFIQDPIYHAAPLKVNFKADLSQTVAEYQTTNQNFNIQASLETEINGTTQKVTCPPVNLTVQPLLPTITGITPLTGAPGTKVTINFENMTPNGTVYFNNTRTNASSNDNVSKLEVTVPQGATSGPIKIGDNVDRLVTFSQQFQVTGINNPPTLTITRSNYFNVYSLVSATAIDKDRDNITLTMSGKPFGSFGPYCGGSPGQRNCVIYVPARLAGKITAVADDGKGGRVTQDINFTALGTISDPIPAQGAIGDRIRINYSNFAPNGKVYFNNVIANVSVISGSLGNYIVATIPPGATTGKIRVESTDGQIAVSNSNFRVTSGINNPPGLTFTKYSNRFWITIVARASDPDGDNVKITSSGPVATFGPLCYNSRLNNNPGRICTLYARAKTTGTVTLTASDGRGGIATQKVLLP